jgi:hypothetical protein
LKVLTFKETSSSKPRILLNAEESRFPLSVFEGLQNEMIYLLVNMKPTLNKLIVKVKVKKQTRNLRRSDSYLGVEAKGWTLFPP